MDEVEPDEAINGHGRRSAIFRAAHKRLDPIDEPRTLGPKRSALQLRKRRLPVNWTVGLLKTNGHRDSLLVSRDGTIAFAIRRGFSGVFVEKRCCPINGPRSSQLMVFETQSIFDRWCDIEPTRFNEPLLCDKLRRRGHELFAMPDGIG